MDALWWVVKLVWLSGIAAWCAVMLLALWLMLAPLALVSSLLRWARQRRERSQPPQP